MFLHNFVMKGLLASIGQMPEYWIINSALNWFDKGILTQDDLETINAKLEPQVEETIEEIVEESVEDDNGEV